MDPTSRQRNFLTCACCKQRVSLGLSIPDAFVIAHEKDPVPSKYDRRVDVSYVRSRGGFPSSPNGFVCRRCHAFVGGTLQKAVGRFSLQEITQSWTRSVIVSLPEDYVSFHSRIRRLMESSSALNRIQVNCLCPYVPGLVIEDLTRRWRLEQRMTERSKSSLCENRVCETVQAVIMMADVTGYTALAELLCAEKGVSSGTETLVKECLNTYFTTLISTIYEYGGDVVKFAGDALICVWKPQARSDSEGVNGSSNYQNNFMQTYAQAAVLCANRCKSFEEEIIIGNEVKKLRLHCGLAYGEVSIVTVGSSKQKEILLTGNSLKRAGACIAYAPAGSVVIHRSIWKLVNSIVSCQRVETAHVDKENSSSGNCYDDCTQPNGILEKNIVVNSKLSGHFPRAISYLECSDQDSDLESPHEFWLVTDAMATFEPQNIEEAEKNIRDTEKFYPPAENLLDMLEAYIPPHIVRRSKTLSSTTVESNDVRLVSTLFIKIVNETRTVGYETNPEHIDQLGAIFLEAQRIANFYDGMIRQFVVDDKGCVLIVCFGVSTYRHQDDALRAVHTAFDFQKSLCGVYKESNENSLPNDPLNSLASRKLLKARIGITTGRAFCAPVGSRPIRQRDCLGQVERREYSVIGNCVNLAARIMSEAYKRDLAILCDDNTEQSVRLCMGKDETWPEFSVVAKNVELKGMNKSISLYAPHLETLKTGSDTCAFVDIGFNITEALANESKMLVSSKNNISKIYASTNSANTSFGNDVAPNSEMPIPLSCTKAGMKGSSAICKELVATGDFATSTQQYSQIQICIGRLEEKKLIQEKLFAFKEDVLDPFVLVEGEEGMGKSNLIEWIRREVRTNPDYLSIRLLDCLPVKQSSLLGGCRYHMKPGSHENSRMKSAILRCFLCDLFGLKLRDTEEDRKLLACHISALQTLIRRLSILELQSQSVTYDEMIQNRSESSRILCGNEAMNNSGHNVSFSTDAVKTMQNNLLKSPALLPSPTPPDGSELSNDNEENDDHSKRRMSVPVNRKDFKWMSALVNEASKRTSINLDSLPNRQLSLTRTSEKRASERLVERCPNPSVQSKHYDSSSGLRPLSHRELNSPEFVEDILPMKPGNDGSTKIVHQNSDRLDFSTSRDQNYFVVDSKLSLDKGTKPTQKRFRTRKRLSIGFGGSFRRLDSDISNPSADDTVPKTPEEIFEGLNRNGADQGGGLKGEKDNRGQSVVISRSSTQRNSLSRFLHSMSMQANSKTARREISAEKVSRKDSEIFDEVKAVEEHDSEIKRQQHMNELVLCFRRTCPHLWRQTDEATVRLLLSGSPDDLAADIVRNFSSLQPHGQNSPVDGGDETRPLGKLECRSKETSFYRSNTPILDLFYLLVVLMLENHTVKKICIAIDDLEWLDDLSMELLRTIVAPNRRNIMVIAAVCSTNVARVRSQLCLSPETTPFVYSLKLKPLTQDDTLKLLRRDFGIKDWPDYLIQRIMDRSNGLPLWAIEYVRGLIAKKYKYQTRRTNRRRTVDNWDFLENYGIDEVFSAGLEGAILYRFDNFKDLWKSAFQWACVLESDFSLAVIRDLLVFSKTLAKVNVLIDLGHVHELHGESVFETNEQFYSLHVKEADTSCLNKDLNEIVSCISGIEFPERFTILNISKSMTKFEDDMVYQKVVDELCREGFLVAVADEDETVYRVAHDYYYRAIYNKIPPSELCSFHARVAQYLSGYVTEFTAPLLAHHFRKAGQKRTAIGYLSMAAIYSHACDQMIHARDFMREAVELGHSIFPDEYLTTHDIVEMSFDLVDLLLYLGAQWEAEQVLLKTERLLGRPAAMASELKEGQTNFDSMISHFSRSSLSCDTIEESFSHRERRLYSKRIDGRGLSSSVSECSSEFIKNVQHSSSELESLRPDGSPHDVSHDGSRDGSRSRWRNIGGRFLPSSEKKAAFLDAVSKNKVAISAAGKVLFGAGTRFSRRPHRKSEGNECLSVPDMEKRDDFLLDNEIETISEFVSEKGSAFKRSLKGLVPALKKIDPRRIHGGTHWNPLAVNSIYVGLSEKEFLFHRLDLLRYHGYRIMMSYFSLEKRSLRTRKFNQLLESLSQTGLSRDSSIVRLVIQFKRSFCAGWRKRAHCVSLKEINNVVGMIASISNIDHSLFSGLLYLVCALADLETSHWDTAESFIASAIVFLEQSERTSYSTYRKYGTDCIFLMTWLVLCKGFQLEYAGGLCKVLVENHARLFNNPQYDVWVESLDALWRFRFYGALTTATDSPDSQTASVGKGNEVDDTNFEISKNGTVTGRKYGFKFPHSKVTHLGSNSFLFKADRALWTSFQSWKLGDINSHSYDCNEATRLAWIGWEILVEAVNKVTIPWYLWQAYEMLFYGIVQLVDFSDIWGKAASSDVLAGKFGLKHLIHLCDVFEVIVKSFPRLLTICNRCRGILYILCNQKMRAAAYLRRALKIAIKLNIGYEHDFCELLLSQYCSAYHTKGYSCGNFCHGVSKNFELVFNLTMTAWKDKKSTGETLRGLLSASGMDCTFQMKQQERKSVKDTPDASVEDTLSGIGGEREESDGQKSPRILSIFLGKGSKLRQQLAPSNPEDGLILRQHSKNA